MRELLLDTIKMTQEELTRLTYEKAELKEIAKANEKKMKAYTTAIANGLVVELPILETENIEDINEEIKLAKAVLVRLETLAEKFIQE